jgi:hypothetical protein
MNATPHFLTFAGLIGLAAFWVWQQQQAAKAAAMPPSVATPDGMWTTPYYLRYNTSVRSGQFPILPQTPSDAQPNVGWALATLYQGS